MSATRRGVALLDLILAAAAAGVWPHLATALHGNPAEPATPELASTSISVRVTRVVDGDTFRAVDGAGHDLGRVRVLGVNAPEVAHDGSAAQCYGPEATVLAARTLTGASTVTLSTDPTQADRDRYGRLLRYVVVDGRDLSLALLRAGAAREFSPAADTTRREVYVREQAKAKKAKKGLWGRC